LLFPFSEIEIEGIDPIDKGEEILNKIINNQRYFPLIFESFYKWRTITQMNWYGMSNASEIPNKMYNQKRWELVRLIKRYIKNHPQDLWARYQLELFLSLPNIQRGGLFGNFNLTNWGTLYGSLRDRDNTDIHQNL